MNDVANGADGKKQKKRERSIERATKKLMRCGMKLSIVMHNKFKRHGHIVRGYPYPIMIWTGQSVDSDRIKFQMRFNRAKHCEKMQYATN